MFNKELYIKTFSALSASEDTLSEVMKMITESKSENKIYKTHRPAPRRFRAGVGFAAALVFATLLFTTTALAFSGVINFSSIFQSIFRSESAQPYIQTRVDTITHVSDGDVDVKLISAFLDSAYVDTLFFELEITDPTGDKLSDSFILFARTADNKYYPLSLDYVNHVQVINENTVRAVFSVALFFRQDSGNIKVHFDLIASGINFVTAQPTGIYIGELIGMEAPLNVPGAEFVEISKVIHSDSTLNISYKHADYALYGWGECALGLMKPDGEIIEPSYTVASNTSDTKEIFFDIGSLNPYDLLLVFSGAQASHVIAGEWVFNITLDLSEEKILAPGTLTGEYKGLRTEAEIGATHIRIRIFNAPNRETVLDIVFDESPLIVNMVDGTSMTVSRGGASGDEEIIGIDYFTEFINPEDVVSIIFRGVEIR